MALMGSPTPLATTYAEARSEFLEAVDDADGRLISYQCPAPGREAENLTLDVAAFGPENAGAAILIVSGTHGVEGYAGSALQQRWLRAGRPHVGDDVAVVLLHALNPYGFSWVRRVNEDNIDLNRNFIDWDAPLPHNEDYDGLADLLVPTDWSDEAQEATTTKLMESAIEHGMEWMQATVSSGQYRHPAGLFYGGAGPAWSQDTLRAIAADQLAQFSRLAIIDLHTGLGPAGHGELILPGGPGDPAYERAVSWWGDDEVKSMVEGESLSADLSGEWLSRLPGWIPGTEVTGVALEFGTVDQLEVMAALRADHWMHAHGDPTGAGSADVRAGMRAAFAVDESEWVDQIDDRFNWALQRVEL